MTVARDARVGFSAVGTDADRDLLGVEWYLDGGLLGVQYRNAVAGATLARATFQRGINFSFAPGTTHTVSAVPFDKAGLYGERVRWHVRVAPRARAFYVSGAEQLVGDANQESELLDFAVREHVTALILYGAHTLVGERPADLSSFIRRARAAGVTELLAPVGGIDGALSIIDFVADRGGAGDGAFDGLVTEYEFWNGAGFGEYLEIISEGERARRDHGLTLSTYLGRFDAPQIAAIRDRVDRVLLHVYSNTPDNALAHGEERMRLLSEGWHRPVEVWPIFSAEEEGDARARCDGSPDRKNFSGDYLGEQRFVPGGALEAAEQHFLRDYRRAGETYRNGLLLSGFAYYHYRLAANYLEFGASSEWNRPPALCRRLPDPVTRECRHRGPQRGCTVHVRSGGSHTFDADGWDEESDLSGVEWYGDGHPHVDLAVEEEGIAQYVGDVGGSGRQAAFQRRLRFAQPGTYTVTAVPFDRHGNYGTHLRWRVVVSD